MWKQEVHKFLEINEIAFEIVQNQSIFEFLFIPKHQLFLHLIDIQTFQNNLLPNNYFQEFSDKINTQNQRIIHLWEDVYLRNFDLIKSRILAMIGNSIRLNARHCYIKRIDMPMAERFLNKNHLQGSAKAKFKYGLFLKPQYLEKYLGFTIYDDVESLDGVDLRTSYKQPSEHNPINLLAVATFSGGRLMKYGERTGQRSYELIRFASLHKYSVMGGTDKLLKTFSEDHQPDDIMSYADRDWSDGRSYEKLGFAKIENSLPQIFYLNPKTGERFSNKNFMDINYLEIFNAGSVKFIKNTTKKSSVESTEDFIVEIF